MLAICVDAQFQSMFKILVRYLRPTLYYGMGTILAMRYFYVKFAAWLLRCLVMWQDYKTRKGSTFLGDALERIKTGRRNKPMLFVGRYQKSTQI